MKHLTQPEQMAMHEALKNSGQIVAKGKFVTHDDAMEAAFLKWENGDVHVPYAQAAFEAAWKESRTAMLTRLRSPEVRTSVFVAITDATNNGDSIGDASLEAVCKILGGEAGV